jgi:hypothetical protein
LSSIFEELKESQEDIGNFTIDDEDEDGEAEGEGEEEEAPPKSRKRAKKKKKSFETSKAQAKMWVVSFSLILEKSCMMYSKETDGTPFRLSKADQESYQEATENYFATLDFEPSPAMMFLLSTAIISAGSAINAYQIKEQKDATEKRRKENRQKAEQTPHTKAKNAEQGFRDYSKQYAETVASQPVASQPVPRTANLQDEEEETGKDFSHLPEYKERRRYFDIDDKGYYMNAPRPFDGKKRYLKTTGGERTSKASKEVLEMFKSQLTPSQVRNLINAPK